MPRQPRVFLSRATAGRVGENAGSEIGAPGEGASSWRDAAAFLPTTAILGTSRNSNNVPALNQTADAEYNPGQMQAVMNTMNDLINALRR